MFFDRLAGTYDQARPPYPDALFEHLNRLGCFAVARVLEIGAGSGQATGDRVAHDFEPTTPAR
jgi:hypothetical protein